MPHYLRVYYGNTFFFTVVTHGRRPILCTDVVRTALRAAIARVRARRPFVIDAWVLMPDHLHCIWTLPDGDSDYPARWSQIKHGVTHACAGAFGVAPSGRSRWRRRESASIWQRRYWEHCIRNDADMARHCDYIHFNPVRHGLAMRAEDWPYSTLARLVRQGVYPPGWAAGEEIADMVLE